MQPFDDLDALAREAVVGHYAQQKPKELADFGRLVLNHGVLTALEVGTYSGGTAWFLNELNLSVTTLDQDMSHVERFSYITYIEGRSQEVEGLGKYDLVFLDSDHAYNAIAADWDRYSKLVCPGGLFAFHDIVEHPTGFGCECHRFWQELKPSICSVEIIDTEQKVGQWGGIGVACL